MRRNAAAAASPGRLLLKEKAIENVILGTQGRLDQIGRKLASATLTDASRIKSGLTAK
jgi:hypothetical protein